MRKSLVGIAGVMLAILLVVVPPAETLSRSVTGLSEDLAEGTFNPFETGVDDGDGAGRAALTTVGGVTGLSQGGYVPGASARPPDRWSMDRSGFVGDVVIDYVFEPALGAMKRMKAYDSVGVAPSYTMTVADEELAPVAPRAGVRYDSTFKGSFDVRVSSTRPTLIFSPAPDAIITSYSTSPHVPEGLRFLKDGADNYYVAAGARDTRILLNVTYQVPGAYYSLPPFGGGIHQYRDDERPRVDDATRERARLVAARAGVGWPGEPVESEPPSNSTGSRLRWSAPTQDVAGTVRDLAAYFNGFGEGAIPGTDLYQDLYLALGLGEVGCCRHRAFAFAVTTQAMGIPTRVVVNEAHAFAEVRLPTGSWHQVNLGGCGSYAVNNPRDLRPFNPLSGAPQGDPDDAPEPASSSRTSITIIDAPDPFAKGMRHEIGGEVTAETDASLSGVRVEVYLNRTARTTGSIIATGTATSDGRFSLPLTLPASTAVGTYALVARVVRTPTDGVVFRESWSSGAPVDVVSDTRLELSVPEGEGVGARALVHARLTDAAGAPVRDARVSLTVGSADAGVATTNGTGVARFVVTYESAGLTAVTARFDGTPHLVESADVVERLVGPNAIDVEPELTLVRGESWRIEGRVLSNGSAAADEEVALAFLGFTVERPDVPNPPPVARFGFTTDDDGAFGTAVVVDADVMPGAYAVAYSASGLGVTKTVPVRIQHSTVLTVEAPVEAFAGTPTEWRAHALLVDDAGAPMRGAPVALVARNSSGAESWTSGFTNAEGIAELALPSGSAADPGAYTVVVVYNGTADAAAASTATDVTVRAGGPPPLGLPWLPLAARVGAGLLLAGGAAAVIAVGGRRAARGGRSLLVALRIADATRLRVALPDAVPSAPHVWAPGESLRVDVSAVRRARDGWAPRAGAAVTAALVNAGGARVAIAQGRTDAAGLATIALAIPADGSFTLRVHVRGSLRVAGADVTKRVRATDYRREMERAYRALVMDLATRGAPVGAASTPREVERALASFSPDVRDAERVAAAIEWASFTERDVARADFAEFAAALERVRRATPIGGEIPAGAAAA